MTPKSGDRLSDQVMRKKPIAALCRLVPFIHRFKMAAKINCLGSKR